MCGRRSSLQYCGAYLIHAGPPIHIRAHNSGYYSITRTVVSTIVCQVVNQEQSFFFDVFKKEHIDVVSYLSQNVIRPRKKIDNAPFLVDYMRYASLGTASSRVSVSCR